MAEKTSLLKASFLKKNDLTAHSRFFFSFLGSNKKMKKYYAFKRLFIQ